MRSITLSKLKKKKHFNVSHVGRLIATLLGPCRKSVLCRNFPKTLEATRNREYLERGEESPKKKKLEMERS